MSLALVWTGVIEQNKDVLHLFANETKTGEA